MTRRDWFLSFIPPHSAEHNTRYFPASIVGKDKEPKGLGTPSSGSPAGTELQAKQCGERTENLLFGQLPFRVVTAAKERPENGNLGWERWVRSHDVGWSASMKCSEKRQFSIGSWNALQSSKHVCVSSKGSGVLWGFTYFLETLTQLQKTIEERRRTTCQFLCKTWENTLCINEIFYLFWNRSLLSTLKHKTGQKIQNEELFWTGESKYFKEC